MSYIGDYTRSFAQYSPKISRIRPVYLVFIILPSPLARKDHFFSAGVTKVTVKRNASVAMTERLKNGIIIKKHVTKLKEHMKQNTPHPDTAFVL